MSDNMTIKDFLKGNSDFGLTPLETPLTEEEKKLASIAMGVNAAVAQFILEGIIPAEEQIHFMIHLQDFAARIYAGETWKMEGTNHTIALNSAVGKMFVEAANEALVNGHNISEKYKEMAKKAQEIDKQTSLETKISDLPKPTLH